MQKSFWVCFSIACLWIASTGFAGNLLPPDLNERRHTGFTAMFNMDYAGARTAFEDMIRMAPDHPAGYIYLADTVWLQHLAALRRLQSRVYNRSDAFFSKTEDAADPKVEKEFRDLMDKGIARAEARLKKSKNDSAGLYYLGIAKTTSAGFDATVKRSFFAALRNGSKGVDLHRDLLKKDPSQVDAMLSLGVYDYIVGSLPLGVKILVFFGGVHGSKKDGILTLEKVARNGDYARDEAATLLIMLYNREKRLTDALKMLDYFTEKYPGNSLFRLERAMTLAEMSRFRDAFHAFDQLLINQAAMDYMSDMIHYQYAEALADTKSWENALLHYREAARSPKAPEGLATMAHLNAGKCLDILERRKEAEEEYRTVLKRRNVYDTREQAQKYLKNPYRP